ncbi:hypothetical protein Pcinc_011065 [Petrolisthes cinctipes]|uniref:Uncharacterized protein n=1 Tax=Petrolisthes cinctipes TaxID=88211 RepID=A0AAE1G3I7_PETCI|nr:hypothetical protein Pcinc_011065 [Petrolisthes cinctipes]
MGLSVKKGADRGKIPCQPTSIAKRSPEPQTGSHCDPIQSISVHAEKDVKEDPEASSSEKDEETNRFTEFVDDSIVKTEVFLKEESSSQCDITHQDVSSSSLLNTDAVVKLENDMKEEPESCAVSEEIVPSNVDVDLTKLTGVPKNLSCIVIIAKSPASILTTSENLNSIILETRKHSYALTRTEINNCT